MRIHRRGLFGLIGGLAATRAAAQAPQATFQHGVAAGDPLTDRLIIWTRVTTKAPTVEVRWEVATDAAFAKIVRSGRVGAEQARDHTVKVDVAGLSPGVDHHYRFAVGEAVSPVGRARTLTKGAAPDAVLAVVSCQLYPGGLFNAYEVMAGLPRLDAVIHLGDYIYEYGAEPADYGMDLATATNRRPDPPHEIVTLADYRRRHAQYKSDPDLQKAHARAAFICVWDDHESANDAWTGGAENHQPNEGDWAARKAASLRAYYEWMPIREPAAGETSAAINRRFDFGDLASLFMVETRLIARDQQLGFSDIPVGKGPDGQPTFDIASFEAKRQDPSRELLGPEQARWLRDGLKNSRASGRPWQILGSQVVMAEVAGPDAEGTVGPERAAAMMAALPPAIRSQVEASARVFKLGVPYNLDSWDGYPAARERLYASFKESGVRPIVVSGDSHAFWVNELKSKLGETAGVEFGTSAISSPSVGDTVPGFPLGPALAARNEQVLHCDQDAKGFVLLKLTPQEAVAELHGVTIQAKPYTHTVLKRYRVAPGAATPAIVEI